MLKSLLLFLSIYVSLINLFIFRYVNQYLKIFSEYGKRIINVIDNVIDKVNFKSFYLTNNQKHETIDDKAYQKYQEYFNKIVS
jgi:hypothetical protein